VFPCLRVAFLSWLLSLISLSPFLFLFLFLALSPLAVFGLHYGIRHIAVNLISSLFGKMEMAKNFHSNASFLLSW